MRYYLFIALLFMGGCSTSYENQLEKKILTPESVEIYDVNVKNIYPYSHSREQLLGQFPFVSNEPILNFKGKFSNAFYDKIHFRYKSAPLEDVDFWTLRTNPFSEDFIYVLPMWANHFKRVSNDLFEDIGYSYNLSHKEQEILQWWIGQGGILWIEGGIYSTRYDTFKRDGEIASKQILKKIVTKSKDMTFFDTKVNTYIYKSQAIDFVNYVPIIMPFQTKKHLPYFQDISNLQIKTKNYISADFLPKANILLYDKNNEPLVSFVQYGKGGVVFLRPFEFQDKRFDGELLRWKLLFYFLEKLYIKKEKKVDIAQKVKEKKPFVLKDLQFEFDSAKIRKESISVLKPLASYLKVHKKAHLLIAGYTDNVGSKEYNKKLSTQRALAVRNALVKMGVISSQLSYIGYGQENPIASNDTSMGRAKNRRVEFYIVQK